MRIRRVLHALGAVALAGFALPDDFEPFTERERRIILSMSPRPAVPPDPTNAYADDARAAELGQRLFFDTRLSLSLIHI